MAGLGFKPKLPKERHCSDLLQNTTMIVNNDLEGMWKEVTTA
jgi:hypothetical protein